MLMWFKMKKSELFSRLVLVLCYFNCNLQRYNFTLSADRAKNPAINIRQWLSQLVGLLPSLRHRLSFESTWTPPTFALMITAISIEESLEQLEKESAVEEAMIEFASDQPAYVQYLRTDTFDLLTPAERDYLQYLALVLYGAVQNEEDAIPMLGGEDIETWEERCWEWLEPTVGKPMALRLDIFFKNIDQEELLAFAEDSLVDPDENEGDENDPNATLFDSGPSRELGFVALASLIAALDEALGS